MKLDNKKIVIPEMDLERIDDELIVFIKQSEKIISFNKTASIIYDHILQSYNVDQDITIYSLLENIKNLFKLPDTNDNQIKNDITEIVEEFFKQGILIFDE